MVSHRTFFPTRCIGRSAAQSSMFLEAMAAVLGTQCGSYPVPHRSFAHHAVNSRDIVDCESETCLIQGKEDQVDQQNGQDVECTTEVPQVNLKIMDHLLVIGSACSAGSGEKVGRNSTFGRVFRSIKACELSVVRCGWNSCSCHHHRQHSIRSHDASSSALLDRGLYPCGVCSPCCIPICDHPVPSSNNRWQGQWKRRNLPGGSFCQTSGRCIASETSSKA